MNTSNNTKTQIIHTKVQAIHTDDAKWYAIYTKSRFEKKIYQDLQKAKLQVFLPLIKEKRIWSDRVKTVLLPLLPSYVFVKLLQCQLYQLFYYPGVVRIVSFEGKPCEIKEEEIDLLEKIVTHGFQVHQAVSCQVEVGDSVRIVRGALKGWEGKVERTSGQSRVYFQLDCIQQAISVEVATSDIEII